MKNKIKVFLVDDEPLAIKRLTRLLKETGKVEIVGQTSEPLEALKIIPTLNLDAVFLDIQMPDLNGFELLQKLKTYPPVIFTTAFDEFALKAFDAYAIDYLLKPIETERLVMAIEKLEQMVAKTDDNSTQNIEKLLKNLTDKKEDSIERIASRIGTKVQILDVNEITHFFAEDKLTYANTIDGKNFPLDDSLNKLEEKLDSKTFLRVHRSTVVNLNFIEEVHGWFSGRILIRLKDSKKTEIIVARNRVKILKKIIGI
jgi:two-component system LytT family response regulator